MAGDSDALVEAIHRAALEAATAHGCATDCARAIAETLCRALRRTHGGERWYLPRPSRADRDAAILGRLAIGDAPAMVAKQIGVNRSTVARIRQRRSCAPEDWEL